MLQVYSGFVLMRYASAAISDFRQSPFKGAFKHYLIQGTNRTLAQLPYVIPPTIIGKQSPEAPRCRLHANCLDTPNTRSLRRPLMGKKRQRIQKHQGGPLQGLRAMIAPCTILTEISELIG